MQGETRKLASKSNSAQLKNQREAVENFESVDGKVFEKIIKRVTWQLNDCGIKTLIFPSIERAALENC